MSRSQPQVTNPCQKWIDFKSDEGKFYYFDKSIGEKGKNVEVPLPIYFAVLDELSVVTGFNKRHDCGIISNEISSVKNEILRVRTFKGGESVTGLYADIRDSIIAMGGKFTKSVYALLINDDMTTEFCNFKFRGAAFSSWLDKKFNPMNFIVGITECVEEKNGNTKYMVPIFKAFKSNPQIDAAAVEQDKVLQEYLKVYKASIPEKEIEHAAAVEPANPLTDGFVANDKWQGKSKSVEPVAPTFTREQKMEVAKDIIRGGKVDVKSMSKIEDLPQGKDETFPDDPDDLPFILTIPIALGILMQFMI